MLRYTKIYKGVVCLTVALLFSIFLSIAGHSTVQAGAQGQQIDVVRDRSNRATSVLIRGYNQWGQYVQWRGNLRVIANSCYKVEAQTQLDTALSTAANNPQSYCGPISEAITLGWWWKGRVDVDSFDSRGIYIRTNSFDIPSFDWNDVFVVHI